MNLTCPYCDVGLFQGKGDKLKMRTRILVVRKSSGCVETNCPSCKKALILPLTFEPERPLEKSEQGPRFGLRLDTRTKPQP